MSNYSTIQVTNETKSRLNALKLTPKESYENVMLRLLDVRLNGREFKYCITSIDKQHVLYCQVDWGRDDSPILFYDHDRLSFDIPHKNVEGWGSFVKQVKGLENLVNILAILEEDDVPIRAGDLLLSRV